MASVSVTESTGLIVAALCDEHSQAIEKFRHWVLVTEYLLSYFDQLERASNPELDPAVEETPEDDPNCERRAELQDKLRLLETFVKPMLLEFPMNDSTRNGLKREIAKQKRTLWKEF